MNSKEQRFKQTEIGLIPEDWEVKPLNNVSEIKTGPFGSALHQRDYVVDGTPIITVEHLGDRGIIHQNLPMVSDFDRRRLISYSLVEGDIAFSRVGSVDRNSLITQKENGWLFSGRLLRIRINQSKVDPNYLSHHLQQESVKQRIRSVAVGQTMASLNTQILNRFEVSIPTKAEQTAIATALSDADGYIAHLEKLIAKKRLLKQGAMQELLKPKEGWVVKRLGEVAEIYRGGSPRPIEAFLTTDSNGINWIKIGDVGKSAKFINTTDEKIIPEGASYSRFVKEGDFLLSNSMSFGRPYILKTQGCIHDGWLVIQNYQNDFDREYLYYVLGSEFVLTQYKSMASGSSVLNLNKEVVKNVLIDCPQTLEEQTRISSILGQMDSEIESLEGQLAKAKSLKQGMMQQLLTGKIRLV